MTYARPRYLLGLTDETKYAQKTAINLSDVVSFDIEGRAGHFLRQNDADAAKGDQWVIVLTVANARRFDIFSSGAQNETHAVLDEILTQLATQGGNVYMEDVVGSARDELEAAERRERGRLAAAAHDRPLH